jgi:hypothetical protein
VPGGGDCLYHAVLMHFTLAELGVDRGMHTSDVAALRAALAAFIETTPQALTGPAKGAVIDTERLKQERNDHHDGADLMIYVIQDFIESKGLHYNLRIYTFTNQLAVLDLGRTTDPELPIAQWQNHEGGHCDRCSPCSTDASGHAMPRDGVGVAMLGSAQRVHGLGRDIGTHAAAGPVGLQGEHLARLGRTRGRSAACIRFVIAAGPGASAVPWPSPRATTDCRVTWSGAHARGHAGAAAPALSDRHPAR